MHKKVVNHLGYYFSLLAVLLLGFFIVISIQSSPQLQMLVVAMMTFAYVTIGILHHYVKHDINAKIVIEYVLIGSMGIAIAYFLLASQ